MSQITVTPLSTTRLSTIYKVVTEGFDFDIEIKAHESLFDRINSQVTELKRNRIYDYKIVPAMVNEFVYFEKAKTHDTHGTFDEGSNDYTIPVSGVYTVVKHFQAGDKISNPLLVSNRQLNEIRKPIA